MEKKVPRRIATTLMNSLKGGVTPRIGLEYITVGREQEIKAFLNDVQIIEEGGATFRFIEGRYGSGKSFLFQTIRNHVMDRGFVVIDADLSSDRYLKGSNGKGLATYKELIQNMSTKTCREGQALPLILEQWISSIKFQVMQESQENIVENVKKKIYETISSLEGMVYGFDFAKLISMYYEAYEAGDDDKKSKVLKWFRGEYSNKTEAKHTLGINIVIEDENWYEYIKLFAKFFVSAGYKGLIVLIDELKNLYDITSGITRQYNYEKILTMYNDTLQGKAKNIGIIMGGDPKSIEDQRRGIFSYEALRSRLTDGKFVTKDMVNLMNPIIRIQRLTPDELYILIEKLRDIHSNLHEYTCKLQKEELMNFIKIQDERLGANKNLTPRDVIKEFIGILDLLYQNPNKTFNEIIADKSFEFAEGESNSSEEDSESSDFADFEI